MVRQHLDNHRPALPAMSSPASIDTDGSAVDRVLAATWPILLDFDGPVTFFYLDGRNRKGLRPDAPGDAAWT